MEADRQCLFSLQKEPRHYLLNYINIFIFIKPLKSHKKMDPLKEAFHNIKKDINFLNFEMIKLKSDLQSTNQELIKICEILKELAKNQINQAPTHQAQNQTTPTYIPTHQHTQYTLKDQKMPFSTGNEGVPTDKQTNRQTDNKPKTHTKIDENPIDNAAKVLESLDEIKKEIRLKFKRLTEQEVLVFSTLYQLEEESSEKGIDYKTLAVKLNLTESSIRDYVGRLIKKGIPVEKHKINNKTILLSISKNLKKIASLATILQLRDL